MTASNSIKGFIFLLFSFLMLGCTSSYESVTQVDDTKAFILLTGNFEGASLQINKNDPILLSDKIETFKLDGNTVAKFEVRSGTNEARVYKDGILVLYRKLYVTNGNSIEVNVK
ncbi:MAG: hypothetical protein ACI9O6_000749 [Glaciecola sp.]|jgi:hypothetical protein